MPVSVKINPFNVQPPIKLRIPQANVLKQLMPTDSDISYPTLWPTLNRVVIADRIGYKTVSGAGGGLVGRTIRGRQKTVKMPRIIGLIELGLVEELFFDIDGVIDKNFRITTNGIRTYQAHIKST